MSDSKKIFGREGEDAAVEYLINNGYEIIERNYNFSNMGEIDIIAKDPVTGYTAFIEVKSRKNLEYGDPVNAITKSKFNQMIKMAELYLYDKEIKELDCRVDVITILFRQKLKPVIEHYENVMM